MLKKFRNWLNFNPPGALSARGWTLFDIEFKEKAPIRHWLINDFYDAIILPIKWKKEEITNWIRYRTYDRYHVLKLGLKPEYYDVSTQILHVNFNLLKDFVEVKQAWHSYWCSEKKSLPDKYIPFWRTYKRIKFRSPELGMKYLDWASTLDDPNLPPSERCDHQAVTAREIKFLYTWWVNIRPQRKEVDVPAYNDQGLGMLSCLDAGFDRTKPDFVQYQEAIDINNRSQIDWEIEDEGMLIRLIKIREQLWV